MNRIFTSLLVATISAGSASVFASGQTGPVQSVEIVAPSVAVAAAQVVRSQPGFESNFAMSTGRTLGVQAQGEALQVQYGKRASARLHYDGQGRFVSGDGRVSLQFALNDRHEAEFVRMSVPANWR